MEKLPLTSGVNSAINSYKFCIVALELSGLSRICQNIFNVSPSESTELLASRYASSLTSVVKSWPASHSGGVLTPVSLSVPPVSLPPSVLLPELSTPLPFESPLSISSVSITIVRLSDQVSSGKLCALNVIEMFSLLSSTSML